MRFLANDDSVTPGLTATTATKLSTSSRSLHLSLRACSTPGLIATKLTLIAEALIILSVLNGKAHKWFPTLSRAVC
jgi:hypothetical protein